MLRAAMFLLLPALAAAAPEPAGPDVRARTERLVESWRRAWEEGDIDTYAGFYGADFRSRGMDRDAWSRYKATVFRRSGDIVVEVSDLHVYLDGDRIRAEFNQRYRSDVLEDWGHKTLVLTDTSSGLRIVGERWKSYPSEAPVPAPKTPEVAFQPVTAKQWGEGLPSDHVPEAGQPIEHELPGFEPSLAEKPDEDLLANEKTVATMASLEPTDNSVTEPRVVEEIVAKVNDSIITMSDLEAREREQDSYQLYRDYSGEELQEKLHDLRSSTIEELINEVLLLQRAKDLGVDMDAFVRHYLEDVKKEQGVTTDAELEKLLQQEGLTLAEFKERIRRRRIPQRLIYEEVTSRIEVSDDDVRRYYEEHPEEFQASGGVELSEIVLLLDEGEDAGAARRAADEIYQRLLAGESFEDLARRVSETPSAENGGHLGLFRHGEMSPELEQVAFSLGEGEISQPILTSHGYHILKLDRKVEPHVTPLAEVSDKIRERLTKKLYDAKLQEYLDGLYRTNLIEVNEAYRKKEAALLQRSR